MKNLLSISKNLNLLVLTTLILMLVFSFKPQASPNQVDKIMTVILYGSKSGPNLHLIVDGKEIEKISVPTLNLSEPAKQAEAINAILNRLVKEGWTLAESSSEAHYIFTK